MHVLISPYPCSQREALHYHAIAITNLPPHLLSPPTTSPIIEFSPIQLSIPNSTLPALSYVTNTAHPAPLATYPTPEIEPE